MNYAKLRKLKERFYFSIEDLANLLKIKTASARVLCSRYIKKGYFVRLKRNFYVLNESWESFNKEELLRITNMLQVPSYISFMTALSIYELTTQVQKYFFESVSLKRSMNINIKGIVFNYYKFKKQYYFDFIKKDDIFIASREKAFIDAVYLYSLGKYKLDFDSIDLNKLDKVKLKNALRIFPEKTKIIIKKLCKI